MKKLGMLFIAFFLGTALYANEGGRTDEQCKLRSDMRAMMASLNTIQNAFFYSDKDGMIAGVKSLQEGLGTLEGDDNAKYLPQHEQYADKFAQKRAHMISMYANDLLNSLKENDMDEAKNNYYQILNQCASCHLRIRKW